MTTTHLQSRITATISELITTENIYSVAKSIDAIKVFFTKINAGKEVHKQEYLKNEGIEEEYKFVHPLRKILKNYLANSAKRKPNTEIKIELDFAKTSREKLKSSRTESIINDEETITRHLKSLRHRISGATEVGIVKKRYLKSYHHQVEKFYDFIKLITTYEIYLRKPSKKLVCVNRQKP